MEKNRKRAIRRHHYDRLKKTRKNYWGRTWNNHPMDEGQLGVVANTPTPCSCFGCGNPRKYFKTITTQEWKSLLSFYEQCEEVEYYNKPSKRKVE